MNYDMDSTICAISTPAGVGGIAVARVSGPDAIDVVQKIWKGKNLDKCPSHTVHLGTVLDSSAKPLDQAVVTLFRAPASFTGQNVVEIAVHGSRYVQHELIASLCNAGAQLAAPGQFTRRAFAAGRLDLTQAEAVADIIASTDRASHRLAMNQMRGGVSKRLQELTDQLLELASLLELELDFSEEDVEFASRRRLLEIAHEVDTELARLIDSFAAGNAILSGIPVAIAGATNVGKSSLLNALVGHNRAIVSDIHGTTRDLVEDTVTLGDYTFRFTDTAGLRQTTDTVEAIGIDRARQAIGRATIILAVVDASAALAPGSQSQNTDDLSQILSDAAKAGTYTIVCVNKTDIADPQPSISQLSAAHPKAHIIAISALTGTGIDKLRQAIINAVDTNPEYNAADITITNTRHQQELSAARRSITRVIQGLNNSISGDFIAQDLRDVISHLAAVTGSQITTPQILQTIFSRFCIGK